MAMGLRFRDEARVATTTINCAANKVREPISVWTNTLQPCLGRVRENRGLVAWGSKLITIATVRTAEAEYNDLSESAKLFCNHN